MNMQTGARNKIDAIDQLGVTHIANVTQVPN